MHKNKLDFLHPQLSSAGDQEFASELATVKLESSGSMYEMEH